MLSLALEQSTAQGSLALLEGDKVIRERSWIDSRSANRQAYSVIKELIGSGTLDLRSIDLFVAGIGPGSFTGMRMAVTTIRALALPDHKPAMGISSGRALAWSKLAERGGGEALVAGDARRDRYWLARFAWGDGLVRQNTPWSLIARREIEAWLVPGLLFLSPDGQRIPELVESARAAGLVVPNGDQAPMAGDIGRLAFLEHGRNQAPESLEPIYIHPAVFVAPRFA